MKVNLLQEYHILLTPMFLFQACLPYVPTNTLPVLRLLRGMMLVHADNCYALQTYLSKQYEGMEEGLDNLWRQVGTCSTLTQHGHIDVAVCACVCYLPCVYSSPSDHVGAVQEGLETVDYIVAKD